MYKYIRHHGYIYNKKRSELDLLISLYQSGLRGSNSLPPPWQGGALPDELNPHIKIMPPDGIEPSTRGFSVPCSTD